MKAADVAKVIEKVAPRELAKPDDIIGFLYGDKTKEVKRVGVTWMASLPVLKEAGKKKIDLLIVHEPLLFKGEDKQFWYKPYGENEQLVNQARKKILDNHKICVYRAHSNWDATPVVGVIDSLGTYLGLGEVVMTNKFNRVYQVPATTALKFARDIKILMPNVNLLVYGDSRKKVEKVSAVIGGFGWNLTNMLEEIARSGVDLVITGDLAEYTIMLALDLGLSVIQTLHSETERPGLLNQYDYLKIQLPKLEIHFLESGAARYPGSKISIL